MGGSAMVWFDLKVEKTEKEVNVSKFIKEDGSIDWESWLNDIAERGRRMAKESAEWQEEALKKAKIRV